MYCKKCGKQTPDDKDFCLNCGASLKYTPHGSEKTSDKGKVPIIILWSFVAVLVVGGLAAYNIAWGGSSAEDLTVSVIDESEALPEVTKQITTTTEYKEYYYISKSEAERIAGEYFKDKYDDYSPVVIGEVTFDSTLDDTEQRYTRAYVSGHYWKKDKYGHSDGSKDFSESVSIDKLLKTTTW